MMSYFKPFLFFIALVIILRSIGSSLSIVPSIISRKIIDNGLIEKNLRNIIMFSLASLGFSLGYFVLTSISGTLNLSIKNKMERDMKNKLFEKLIKMDHDFFKTEPHSDIYTRLTDDVTDIISAITNLLPSFIANIMTLVTAFTAMGSVNWRLLLIGISVLPFEILPSFYRRKVSYDQACKNTNIFDFIMSLEKGYDTEIGNGKIGEMRLEK